MTAIATLDPPDACPVCPPGIPDAAFPAGHVTEAGGWVADYECSSCGSAWSTRWDRHGFPVERLLAVAPSPRDRDAPAVSLRGRAA